MSIALVLDDVTAVWLSNVGITCRQGKYYSTDRVSNESDKP